jgi:3'-phosphoadenosine 5'-phosphosulfate (PAPS) 3'-phosphatase
MNFGSELPRLLEEAEMIAREAGAAIMGVYGGNFSTRDKEDNSPLTEADTAAHEIIWDVIGWSIRLMALRNSSNTMVNSPST